MKFLILPTPMNAAPRKCYEATKLTKRLRHLASRGIADFNMIDEGGKVMGDLVGSKDTYTMLDILLVL